MARPEIRREADPRDPADAPDTRDPSDAAVAADASNPKGDAPDPAPARAARGYARMREADEAARAELEPLAAGERPLAVTLSAALAAAVGLANLALLASGWQLRGIEQPGLVESLALPVFMLVCAVGMWQRRYWALLVFQGILTVTILFSLLFLLRASNLQAVLLTIVLLGVCGSLFWFLVKAMARTQMPRQTSR